MKHNTWYKLVAALTWMVMVLLVFPVLLPAGEAGAYPLVLGLLPKWFVILLALFVAQWILVAALFAFTLAKHEETEPYRAEGADD